MRNRPVTAKIEIPFVIGWIHFVAAHVRLQYLKPLFALAAADDFANPRHEQIHRRHRFAVIVQSHVERFDLLRIIEDRDRTLLFLGQPTLVFRLQIQSVFDRKLEFFAALFEKLDRLGIRNALKFSLKHEVESRQ